MLDWERNWRSAGKIATAFFCFSFLELLWVRSGARERAA